MHNCIVNHLDPAFVPYFAVHNCIVNHLDPAFVPYFAVSIPNSVSVSDISVVISTSFSNQFTPQPCLSTRKQAFNVKKTLHDRCGLHVVTTSKSVVTTTMTSKAPSDLAVMVNGVPGKMGIDVSKAVIRRGIDLVPYSLTGNAVNETHVEIDGQNVTLVKPDQAQKVLNEIQQKYKNVIAVDYTHPSAANPNATLYSQEGISFVMGTTGGNVQKMRDEVLANESMYAVVAPNMGKQIVAFQAAMDILAKQFPGSFRGYKMTVTESHQSSKADTSGTAKAIVGSFKELGIDFQVEQIEMVRDPSESMSRMGVPKDAIAGHAFHTYRLTSPDSTVSFEFQHNVCGRLIYAEGTVDAVEFLAKQIAKRDPKRFYDMIDVLHEGMN